MDQDSEDGLFWDSGDDVIEVDSTPPRRGISPTSLPTIRHEGRPSQVIPPNHLPGFAETFGPNSDQNSRRRENRLPTATFIDLTEEPDSPVEAQPSRQSSQTRNQTRTNPRRTNSQRISPPTLSRSDGTISRSNVPDFIDLTGDSPDDDIPQIIESSPRTPNLDHLSHLPRDSLIRADLVRHSRIFGGFRRRLAGLLGSDFLELDLRRPESIPFPFDGFVRRPVPEESRPKPSMEPTPDTREGFTRNTCAEPTEEMVIVCPNCNEELAYDPTGATPAQSSTSGKGTKRKRTVPEHHFWALKKCGHVYCSDCFENRRPTKSNRRGVGFPMPDGKEASSAPNEMRCAVQGCDTKVAPKAEWVGLYT
ncbi:hypothetical protein ACO1O0_007683 [Amphichorda felina]